jgi:hypothetical protein
MTDDKFDAEIRPRDRESPFTVYASQSGRAKNQFVICHLSFVMAPNGARVRNV